MIGSGKFLTRSFSLVCPLSLSLSLSLKDEKYKRREQRQSVVKEVSLGELVLSLSRRSRRF